MSAEAAGVGNCMSSDGKREMLRHAVATLAYRGSKVLRGVGAEFAGCCPSEGCRTPLDILTHVSDLLNWALSIASGPGDWKSSKPDTWQVEVARFYSSLEAFDEYLASEETLHAPVEKLFQGPIADALTHVGQLAMLRRMAGKPVRGENYFVAEISSGRVGPDQAAPKREFG